ncbi:MAG: hypothetical protein HYX68_27205 [Planctomycetes bacterium]|nr:hypothetical protein [Planctomycetota bacterium]
MEQVFGFPNNPARRGNQQPRVLLAVGIPIDTGYATSIVAHAFTLISQGKQKVGAQWIKFSDGIEFQGRQGMTSRMESKATVFCATG